VTTFQLFLLTLLLVGATASLAIVRSALGAIRQNPEAPPVLPGIWPEFAQKKYARLSEPERKLWWRRYWLMSNYVMLPCLIGALVAFVFGHFSLMLALALLLATALIYTML
jgi:hypothetical protein